MKKWNFKPANDHIGEKFYTTLTAGMYGAGMLIVFNPVFAAVTMGISACAALAVTAAEPKLKLVEKLVTKDFEKNKAPDDYYKQNAKKIKSVQNTVNKLAADLNIQKTPQVMILKDESFVALAKKRIPLWMKIFKRKEVKEMIERVPHYSFAAISGANILVISETGLNNNFNRAELKYVLAHECCHIKAKDGQSFDKAVGMFTKMNTRLAFAGLAVALVASPFIALPVAPAILTAAIALPLLHKSVDFATKFASRVMERRADRNAVYITNDVKAPLSANIKMHPEKKQKKKMPYWVEVTKTHPPFHKRMENLKRSWDKVSKAQKPNAGAPPRKSAPKPA